MEAHLRLRWLRGDAAGTVDIFPQRLFAAAGRRGRHTHVVEGRDGWRDSAQFVLQVIGSTATLDYSACPEYNDQHGMELGVLRLTFKDATRHTIAQAAWNDRRLSAKQAVFGSVPLGATIPARLLPPSVSSRGAGFGTYDEIRKAEKAAIAIARRLLEAKGWLVQSVERDQLGYDLHCVVGTHSLHVEVKGIRGAALDFILTDGELRRARSDPAFRLLAITQVLAHPKPRWYSGEDLLKAFTLKPLQWRASNTRSRPATSSSKWR